MGVRFLFVLKIWVRIFFVIWVCLWNCLVDNVFCFKKVICKVDSCFLFFFVKVIVNWCVNDCCVICLLFDWIWGCFVIDCILYNVINSIKDECIFFIVSFIIVMVILDIIMK